MPRLFVALEISRDAAMRLALLRGGLPAARWIDPENYHLTLRFIGDVEARFADEAVAALDRIEAAPFDLQLLGLDAFGSKKPHSIYAGVAPSPALEALQGDVDRALRRIGLAPDAKKFTPHVTLARLRQPKVEDVARYLAGRGDFRSAPFRVGRFVLFSSKDSVGGGPYLVEEAFDLTLRQRQEIGSGAPMPAPAAALWR
ncbi:RNA 2',3'-cyclic phosphodiesterase [Aureimonas endophytica]|uniref:RNA 2',3'-cyclic phosphodiesterase n=1 Tax=Aureimonas endophytica TaxID=2027858 RepID=A0A916ZH65_9HYPH|nr:RNA 2',3'-cyclic phosphodiesterase [Aureimonas endophytica]GGD96193.1 RNA 2',3'-cyclic phosphodiesterase [Aureimonas endophytica]